MEVSSSGTYATLIAERPILDGSARAKLLDWGSKKIHRVVKSTVAAEAAAMSFGFHKSLFARAVYSEINASRSTAWQMTSKDIPLAIQLGPRWTSSKQRHRSRPGDRLQVAVRLAQPPDQYAY